MSVDEYFGHCSDEDTVVVARARLLMHGDTVHWPPRDVYGKPIDIGDQVVGYSTMCLQDAHVFYVGSLRLQYRGARLDWVVCCYEDSEKDTGRYFESWAEDCRVLRALGEGRDEQKCFRCAWWRSS